jgi:exopolysaccharide production protein ExoQ
MRYRGAKVVINRMSVAPVRGPSAIYAVRRPTLSPALMFFFVVFSGSLYLTFGSFYDGELSGKSGNSPFYMGLLFVTYAVMFYQLAAVGDAALKIAAKSFALLAFVCCGFVSLVTADAVGISAMRYVLYILTILTSLAISTRYTLDEFCENFFWTSFAITMLHLLAYPLLAGRIIYDPLARKTLLGVISYAGLFPHKSFAGTFFSLTLMISVVRFFGSRALMTKYSSFFLACASGVALLIAGAVGRLVFLVLSTIAGIAIGAVLRQRVATLMLFSIGLLLAVVVYLWIGEYALFYFFGREADMTGRTDVFEFWPRFFFEKPLFGYGFDGFFTDVGGSAGNYLSNLAEGKGFASFESDYLDILIQFGAIGGIFFACILLRVLRNAIRSYNANTSKYKFVPLLFAMWSILGASLDGGILIQNSLACLIVFWLYFGVDRSDQAPGGTKKRNLRRVGSPRTLVSENRRRRLLGELR